MIVGMSNKLANGKPTNFLAAIANCFVLSEQNVVFPTSESQQIASEFVERFAVPGIRPKYHTIRKGNRHKPGRTLQIATGVRTKHYHCHTEVVCISVQDIEILTSFSEGRHFTQRNMSIKIDDDFWLENERIEELCLNDGLDPSDFFDWFFSNSEHDSNYGCNVFNGQIIHWTKMKYI